jgi:hypothetical protein
MASVCSERIQQMSSAFFAKFGSSSVFIIMPHCPAALNWNFDGAMGNLACPLVIVVRRWPLRMLSGRSLSYHFIISGL